jgi:RNA polymerase sigma factor for flagellar operon FliA
VLEEPSGAAAAAGLFLAELETIERAIAFACRRNGLRDEDAEDFASFVRLKLIDRNYAVIRKCEQRASFAAYISVVVQRLLLDYRISHWGKWHASSQAKHLGDVAVTIEAMLYRDGSTIEEMLPALRRRWPSLTRAEVENIAARLPGRTRRPRLVDLDSQMPFTAESVPRPGFAPERRELSKKVAAIVRATMRDVDDDDRLLFRLRFEGGMSVADIARMLRVEQKPLYRRLQRCLVLLRQRLESAGIRRRDVDEIIDDPNAELDFGLDTAPLPKLGGQDGEAV